MKTESFTISEIMFMVDIMKEDKIRWSKIGNDKDVTDAYDSIISKLENRNKEHQGMRKAINSLLTLSKAIKQ